MLDKVIDRVLASTVKQGVLEITHANGRIVKFGESAPGWPEVRIRFTDQEAVKQILRDQSLGAGEAYMEGQLVIEEGDIMGLVTLLRANRPFERDGKGRKSAANRLAGKAASLLDQVNRQARARANVSHHYDIGNDLYRLMLDRDHMQYSCAYWPNEGMTLEQAQQAKLAHIAAKLRLEPGNRVLDIGCGWGGMAIYLARHFDVSVLGITLSTEQLALACERAKQAGVAGRVSFELVDYRDLAERGDSFDRIVSVGMFEHVGRPQFETFFQASKRLLKEDGAMLLHTIGRMGSPGSTDAFTRKYIFPGGYIPALSETVAASEKHRLIATDVENLRLHYAFTLREWYARCLAHRREIEAMYDERFFRLWIFYLAGATAAFESGGMCNYQIQYARDRRALPLSRDYMQQAERLLMTSGTAS
ncbi:cyclopropane-fatty-acyl-phospholipid synthase family protein [Tsuneonella sp. CC-YZS046]|uniref:cyclopropane-fatty-acyl-phospholipid synthase family protein n=1 Tax=Tsuneonella sp. CC-YZS046 TaxID=3042152 RepID=UPI002D7701D7|nr:cyclopropane-fatty-acyl-phospholipid synthase family protein [Tsuneonella sp. CC-YZS046]WRO68009.1 cyclopropane-fatty-acyl-phospholipid synthase family protein [Tsuneonella sp. CC-YZS046]